MSATTFNQAQRGLPTWLTAHPDTPPATPNAKDDEFDVAVGTTLDSKWTGYGATLTTAFDGIGRLVITAPLGSGAVPNLAAIEQAAPSGNFEVRIKTSQMSASFYSIFGIYLRRSNNLANVVQFRNSATFNDHYIQTSHYTSPTGTRTAANDTALGSYGIRRDNWLRITYVSGTITFQYCLAEPYADTDWKTISSEADSSFLGGAPTQIGISADSLSSTVQAKAGIFYFRVAALP